MFELMVGLNLLSLLLLLYYYYYFCRRCYLVGQKREFLQERQHHVEFYFENFTQLLKVYIGKRDEQKLREHQVNS